MIILIHNTKKGMNVLDYDVFLARDYSKRTLENYEKCKDIVDNEVTFLLNCILGILTVTIPSNPYRDMCYISEKLTYDDFKEYDIKNTIIENRTHNEKMISYLYCIRNSSAHRYDYNFKRILSDNDICAIEFISSVMIIRLTLEQLDKLIRWLGKNIK